MVNLNASVQIQLSKYKMLSRGEVRILLTAIFSSLVRLDTDVGGIKIKKEKKGIVTLMNRLNTVS